jgi:hypothetical protein
MFFQFVANFLQRDQRLAKLTFVKCAQRRTVAIRHVVYLAREAPEQEEMAKEGNASSPKATRLVAGRLG